MMRQWAIYSQVQEIGGQLVPDAKETPANEELRAAFVRVLAERLPPPARILAPGALMEAIHLARAGYDVYVPQLGDDNAKWLAARSRELANPNAVHVFEMDASAPNPGELGVEQLDGYFSCQFHEHLLSPFIHVGETRRCLRDGAIVFVDACGTKAENPDNDLACHVNLVPAAAVAHQWTYWGFRVIWTGPHGDARPQFLFEKLPWGHPEFKHSLDLRRLHDQLKERPL
jgi:hypothetical protein